MSAVSGAPDAPGRTSPPEDQRIAKTGCLGMALLLFALMAYPFIDAWVHGPFVQADRIAGARSPLVVRASAVLGILPSSTYLDITVPHDASDAAARTVWCDVALPAGADPVVTWIHPDGTARWDGWPPPNDCSDPADIPSRGADDPRFEAVD